MVISLPANGGDKLRVRRWASRLQEMLAEASLLATTPILIHAVAARRDVRHTAEVANAAHELIAIAVGQTKIAHEQIERLRIGAAALAPAPLVAVVTTNPAHRRSQLIVRAVSCSIGVSGERSS